MTAGAPSPRVLCLHYLAGAGAGEGSRRRLAVTPDGLRAIVERERSLGRRAGTLAEAVADPSRFALTFDDAHASLLTTGLPLLRALRVPATVFVPTDFVGTSDEFLAWDDVRALRAAGWTIGSHSRRHARASWRFYDEDDWALRERLDDEARGSRAILERELAGPVVDYAYPYGESTAPMKAAVARAGYERAFTVSEGEGADGTWSGDALAIPRHDALELHGLVRPRTQDPVPISVVIPACDRHAMLRRIVQAWSRQSYPEGAFEVLIVDDGSKASLAGCLEGAAPGVRLIEGGGDETFRAGQARQRGAEAARFETLAFLDADVAVGRDFLWHLDWIHRRVEGAVVLGYLSGYNLHDIGFTHSPADLDRAGSPEALPVIPDRSREVVLKACLDNLDWLGEPWRLAYTGNLSLPRRLLTRVGGFARAFAGWGLEDLDLGYRLYASGAPFVFSRFAVGYHLVESDDAPPRNPFRIVPPARDKFEGYERNLETLESLHPGDPAIRRFVEQARADIDETCGRPGTIGVEFGGACSLACRLHRRAHKCQPGGLDLRDLLDRLAYATKVGATALYLLGGEPAEHPGYLAFLRAARAANFRRVTCETTALPFASDGFAEAARRAGLDEVVVEVLAFDEPTFDAVSSTHGQFRRFLGGLDALERAGIAWRAKVLVDAASIAALPRTLSSLRHRRLPVLEVVTPGEEGLPGRVRSLLDAAGFADAVLRCL